MNATRNLQSLATALQCPDCGKLYNLQSIQTFATCCNQPLLARYSAGVQSKSIIDDSTHSLWRYAALLPLAAVDQVVSLGEGWTPIVGLPTLSTLNEVKLLLKDESLNPTGSFKARGISVAISKAKELGISHCIMPTAGNAGVALSAYAASAGIAATVIMPVHTPSNLQVECRAYGAELILVDGLIDECGRLATELVKKTGSFNMSTMKEPYRLEGKKTMGYEIAEQCDWQLPDIIIYPTGGGTGLIGIWKAFREMQEMGWLGGKLPKMMAVQSENCDPVVRKWNGRSSFTTFAPKPSIAHGLAVPTPFAMDLIMRVLKESGGTALKISEATIQDSIAEIVGHEGVLLSPEGAITYAALKQLKSMGQVQKGDRVLLLNTGSWHNYK